jgi:hypothetical protein
MPVARGFDLVAGLWVPFDGGTPVAPPGSQNPPPPPPPPGGTGMLLGASIAQGVNNDYLAATQAGAGPWTCARRYNSGMFGPTWTTDASGVNKDVGKRASIYSCKPDMNQMAAGALDTQLTTFVNSIPDSHPCVLFCWHEPDVKYRQGGGAGGSFSIPLWKSANTRFMQVVKAVGKPHVYVGICLTNFSAIGGVGVDSQPEAFWFGADDRALIDLVSWDIYLTHDTATTGAHEQSACFDFCNLHGVGYAITEIGIHEGVTNMSLVAGWMHDQADYAFAHSAGGHNSAAFLTWFDSANATAIPVPSSDPALMTASKAISGQYLTPYTSFVL